MSEEWDPNEKYFIIMAILGSPFGCVCGIDCNICKNWN